MQRNKPAAVDTASTTGASGTITGVPGTVTATETGAATVAVTDTVGTCATAGATATG